ncbi:Shugoshin [Fusarium acuminatum]|uniref:Shugoshin n=1 Tax=Fusarium acuminatum TaxID=5515 RepID=A0ABZ2WG38_9HYPO
MARLNEPPVSTDSLETLRKKLLRQNRDLAKSNNIRALRIRELENDCACMLSENLELRGRIIELEKELEDNDTRRIADHALAIKAKLESQLTEWGTLLAGLGLEPPMKRHSPRPRKSTKPRLSFSSARPSPSQRRLRDIAREIEELGHISETKSYPRQSMNPQQILALRSEAGNDDIHDTSQSPELGPPPVSHFIEEEEDPVKIDSPTRSRPTQIPTPTLVQESPKSKLAPPETFTSPQANKTLPRPSPEKKKKEEITKPKETTPIETKPLATKSIETNTQHLVIETPVPQAVKIGSKRKLAARDDMVTSRPSRTNNENENPQAAIEKSAIGEKAGGRVVKELTGIRKDVRDKANATGARKPLAAKSTNNDMTSPKKISKPVAIDEVTAAKADLVRSKASQDRPKSKSKSLAPITIETVLAPQPSAPGVVEMPSNLGTPFTDPTLLSPNSPDSAAPVDTGRGGTPPPGNVNASREPPRPSRRNRTAVSYAEPNLRDKMRRPTKDMLDAVAGEGKYARRSSVAEQAPDTARMKRESGAEDLWKKLPSADGTNAEHEPGSIPASPLAGKGSPADSSKTLSIRSGRRTSMMIHEIVTSSETSHEYGEVKDESASDTTGLSEVDVYEFTPSSPQTEDQTAAEIKKKTAGRRPLRRVSSAVHSEEDPGVRERASSRRRSMML